MTNEKDQGIRAEFYTTKLVGKYIKVNGVPRSKKAFKDMVASGSTQKLENEKGAKLIACLGEVLFAKHPQQINVMDKSNGKIIAVYSG